LVDHSMSAPNKLQGSRSTQDIARGKDGQIPMIAAFSGESRTRSKGEPLEQTNDYWPISVLRRMGDFTSNTDLAGTLA
jgi:hypothetical protein